jgi:hypothetical protein
MSRSLCGLSQEGFLGNSQYGSPSAKRGGSTHRTAPHLLGTSSAGDSSWTRTLANAEIAAVEKANRAYVGRVLRLTLLPPDIVEAMLNGRKQPEMTLTALMRPSAATCTEQWKT